MALDVVTRAEWGARRPRSTPERRDPRKARGATVHHKGNAPYASGAADYPHARCDDAVRADQNWHMDGNGWSDVAYSFLLCQHGVAYEGRGLYWAQFANGSINTGRTYLNPAQDGWYTIQAMIGSQDPTPKLVARLGLLVAELRAEGVGDEVTPHNYFKIKPCPGRMLTRWAIEHDRRPVGPVPTSGTGGPAGAFPLAAGHAFGMDVADDAELWDGTENDTTDAAVRSIQREVGFVDEDVDGHYWEATHGKVSRWQGAHDLAADGRVGRLTWAKMASTSAG